MKTQTIKHTGKFFSWFALILSIVHLGYTPVLLKEMPYGFPFRNILIYMFDATGAGLLLAAVMMILALSEKEFGKDMSRNVFFFSAIFILVLGISAPIAMRDNPFAYITTFVGLILGVISMFYKFSNQVTNEQNH